MTQRSEILSFRYVNTSTYVFRTTSKKNDCRTIRISLEIYKKLKTVEFFHMWLFIFEIGTLNFCICQKTHFCCSGLGQASSRWINSNFYVDKVSIWRYQMILTFSGLHFLFSMNPWILNRGLWNPHRKINGHFAPMCTVLKVMISGGQTIWY